MAESSFKLKPVQAFQKLGSTSKSLIQGAGADFIGFDENSGRFVDMVNEYAPSLSNPLFDYLASGKLIISSNVSVFKEILSDRKNCIIINNFKINNWVKIIYKAKFELSKINNIKRNAFILSKKYTYIKRAKKMLEF